METSGKNVKETGHHRTSRGNFNLYRAFLLPSCNRFLYTNSNVAVLSKYYPLSKLAVISFSLLGESWRKARVYSHLYHKELILPVGFERQSLPRFLLRNQTVPKLEPTGADHPLPVDLTDTCGSLSEL